MNNSCKIGLLAALAGLGGSGCHPREGRTDATHHLLVHHGFEQAGPAADLSTEKAHTGRFSARADARHKEIRLYQASLGRLCAHRPRRFTLSAWTWAPDFGADAAVVLSIDNPDGPAPLLRQFLYVADAGPFGAWKFISQDINLPGDIHSNSRLTIALVSNSDRTVYVDDLHLTELR
jgi:hypothetical protein